MPIAAKTAFSSFPWQRSSLRTSVCQDQPRLQSDQAGAGFAIVIVALLPVEAQEETGGDHADMKRTDLFGESNRRLHPPNPW